VFVAVPEAAAFAACIDLVFMEEIY